MICFSTNQNTQKMLRLSIDVLEWKWQHSGTLATFKGFNRANPNEKSDNKNRKCFWQSRLCCSATADSRRNFFFLLSKRRVVWFRRMGNNFDGKLTSNRIFHWIEGPSTDRCGLISKSKVNNSLLNRAKMRSKWFLCLREFDLVKIWFPTNRSIRNVCFFMLYSLESITVVAFVQISSKVFNFSSLTHKRFMWISVSYWSSETEINQWEWTKLVVNILSFYETFSSDLLKYKQKFKRCKWQSAELNIFIWNINWIPKQ